MLMFMNLNVLRKLRVMAVMLIAVVTCQTVNGQTAGSEDANSYITEVITIGAQKGDGGKIRREYEQKGWTVVNYDLNLGAGGMGRLYRL